MRRKRLVDDTPSPTTPTTPPLEGQRDWEEAARRATYETQMRRCVAYTLGRVAAGESPADAVEWHWSLRRHHVCVTWEDGVDSSYFRLDVPGGPEREVTRHSKRTTHVGDTDAPLRGDARAAREALEFRLLQHGYVLHETRVAGGRAVDQEVGTCWLAAVWNLVMNIPELRGPVWRALGVKRPRRAHVVFDAFLDTEVGRRVLTRYARTIPRADVSEDPAKRRAMLRDPSALRDALGGAGGGYAAKMLKALRAELGLKELRLRDRAPNRAGEDAGRVLEYLAAQPPRLRGVVMVHQKEDRSAAHAIAIVRDETGAPVVYNWGRSGGEEMLRGIVAIFPRMLEIVFVEVPTATKALRFDRVCLDTEVYDRTTRACSPRKRFPRPTCSPPTQVFDRTTRRCRSPKKRSSKRKRSSP